MGVSKGYQPNTFRAISGSLFSTAANWSRGYVPTASDAAVIADDCVIDITRTIGSLVVRPQVTASISGSITLQVNSVLNSLGHISCSGAPNVVSYAQKNNINSISPGTSTFTYTGSSIQSVPGGNYYNVNFYGRSSKFLTSNIFSSGSFLVNNFTVLDARNYNISTLGTLKVGEIGNGDGTLIKSQTGSIIVEGELFGDIHALNTAFNFTGNPSIEVRGGLRVAVVNANQLFYSGKGLWIFSKNNQTLSGGASSGVFIFDGPIFISSSITVTAVGANIWRINDSINGSDSNSKFINQSTVYFNEKSYLSPMLTGSIDITSSANLVGYIYNGNGSIPYTLYRSLRLEGSGNKTLSGNTIISGSLTLDGVGTNQGVTVLELSSSGITVHGVTTIGTGGRGYSTVKKSFSGGSGMLFIGNVNFDVSDAFSSVFDFPTNPDVEFRGGITMNYLFAPSVFRPGSGSFIFTTNNQTFSFRSNGLVSITPKIIISGAISLTSSISSLNGPSYNNTINGTEAGSTFVNFSTMYLGTAAAVTGSFLTGSARLNVPNTTVYIGGDYSATIPSQYASSFFNLGISGTGTKTLGTSSYVSGTLSISSNSILDASGSDLTINGSTTVQAAGKLLKTGPGIVKFNGLLSTQNGDPNQLDFSGGNPTVECRGGLSFQNPLLTTVKTGTGSWYFIGNQTINYVGSYVGFFDAPFIISGSSTVSLIGGIIYFTNPIINGTSGSSTLVNQTAMILTTSQSADNIMRTGSFNYTSSGILGYAFSGNYNLPYTTYSGLYISGSGVKYLTGSTTLNGGISIASGATLELGNYNFTVSGSFGILGYNSGLLSKSGSGNVIFKQYVDLLGGGNPGIDFSLGNPTVELQNGINIQNGTVGTVKTGTGSWYFTINNQGIFDTGGSYFSQFDCPIIISGAISLDVRRGNFRSYGYIDGTEANSRFIMSGSGTTINYYNSRAPMLTGSIDFSSSLNTFIYASASQDIRGGTYRNLTMLSGTKTLQGNVSVLGTLNTGSGATLATINLNGFTLTNP